MKNEIIADLDELAFSIANNPHISSWDRDSQLRDIHSIMFKVRRIEND